MHDEGKAVFHRDGMTHNIAGVAVATRFAASSLLSSTCSSDMEVRKQNGNRSHIAPKHQAYRTFPRHR